jgi:hypothetical protein
MALFCNNLAVYHRYLQHLRLHFGFSGSFLGLYIWRQM